MRHIYPANDRLKIAYLLQTTAIDLAADAGPPVLVRANLRQLKRAGHQIDYYALNGRRAIKVVDADRPAEEQEMVLGLSGSRPFKMLESGLRRAQSTLGLPYFGLFESYRLNDAAGRFLGDYDLCHEYHRLFSLGAARACHRTGTPYVLTVDADEMLESALSGRPLRGLQARYASWSARQAFALAHRIVCVSEATRRRLVEHWDVPADKIAVIPNGVDLARFDSAADPETARADLRLGYQPLVLFVGGFQPWHGLVELVESFQKVRAGCPEATLALVGDGPARPQVERRIDQLNLAGSVRMAGMVPHSEIPAWLAAADVVVAPYPSLPQEMWFSPLKLFEYMAAGRAIVSTRAGQVADVIEHERTGLLVQPGDSEALAGAIVRLLEDPPLRHRLGSSARRQAETHHSWDQATGRLETVYNEAIQRAK